MQISDLLGYPRPIGESSKGQYVDCNWTLFKITRQPFWKWQLKTIRQIVRFCLQPQRTCTWNLKLKLQSKLELRCQNHATYRVQKQKSNVATRQPFSKWVHWKSIGFYPYTQVLGHWSFEFIFKAKLKLESGNQKIQYGRQAAILKLTSLKINRLLPIYISIVPLKFGVDIHSQTKVSLETKISNMAAMRLFWKWHRWKSIGSCLWPPSTCIWNVKLKFESKLDLCCRNHAAYRVQKPKNPIWPPGGHFENDVVENQ